MSEELYHYGTPRHSGRYPWGSGENPQRNKDFLRRVQELKDQGLNEKEIARGLGVNTSQLRARKAIAKMEERMYNEKLASSLKDKGYSNVEIGKRMGLNESSVRSLLDPSRQEKNKVLDSTASMLMKQIADKDYIDVGPGIEQQLGISRTKLKNSIALLEEQGYKLQYIPVDQVGTGMKTTISVLTKDDVTYSDLYKNKDKIRTIDEHSEDSGNSYLGLRPIQNVDGKRIQIRYNEEGGVDKDGLIELRRNVDDLSIGRASYAQVRIGVDGTHFLKGMAMYSDDMPDGVDIIFNTNKTKGTPPGDVYKKMKRKEDGSIDNDNPFGAEIKASGQRGALNIVNEEGDWGKWSKSLSSQMLSKQPDKLAKTQLDLAYKVKKEEYDEILSLTNPAVKKRLLDAFADSADSAAVHLKAAGLPRTGAHVILPFPGLKDNEVYAPNYRNGETLILIRYPHGGTFEIPELKVNNKFKPARNAIGNATDAIGINSKVAERLSGADFDGDTVWAIPNNQGRIKTSSPLKSLVGFDPKTEYKAYPGMPKIKPATKQQKMGDVSNLITDMTIKGAHPDEIARAVRHSMVVIDSEKHNLNYKQSYIDNGIGQLKKKYQGGTMNGASTVISRASSQARVNTRKRLKDDPITGEKRYEYTNESYTNKKGQVVFKSTKSTKMYETNDAFTLSSGTPIEKIYATHANSLKALGNDARRESLAIKPTRYNPEAKIKYAKEVNALNNKLDIALRNAPKERQAQLLANKIVAMKRADNPDMEAADIKKISSQALGEARARTGAKKPSVEITDKEWAAIQSGAISNNKLSQILNNTNLDNIKKLATPQTKTAIAPAKLARAKAMLNSGYTQAEVAEALGVSTTTLRNQLN